MYPWLGQIPGMQQGYGGMTGMNPMLQRILQMQQGGGYGGGYGQPQGMGQFDWSNPDWSQLYQQSRLGDRRGLSSLWSNAPTSVSQGPLGWQTSVTPQRQGLFGGGGIGGLLGNIFGRRA